MTQEHPITPPPELVQQWIEEAIGPDYEQRIATQAARCGADQELEACCEWVEAYAECGNPLRAARRPKTPSLQDQALDDLERIAAFLMENKLPCDTGNIRRALESLPS